MEGQNGSFDAVEVIEHLWIPMPDGVRLAARLWLPRSAEHTPFPALLEYIPYRKADMVRARDERNHPYFAEHGYACLRVDMRGSGDSEGRMTDMYTDAELDDTRHVIAWISEQPWCNGRVGMFGTSWGGTAALQANVDAPDALKAIIAVCATHDRYEDDIHHMGGCLLTDSLEWGATLPVILGSPPTPNLGEDWLDIWKKRIEALTFPLEKWVREEARGAYWRHGSVIHRAERLSCPILAIGGWSDRYSNSVMSLLSARPDLVWGVVGPWGHHYPDQGQPGPAIGFQQLALAWWNTWLKNPEPKPPDWPRLRAWLCEFDLPSNQIERRNGRWIQSGPPVQHVRTEIWHLDTDELSPSPSGRGEKTVPFDLRVGRASGDTGYFGRQGGEPLDQRDDDALCLTFDTPPLAEDCILYGSAHVTLDLAAMSERGPTSRQLSLRLNDIAPNGTSARVVFSVRNLALDETCDKTFSAEQRGGRKVRISLPTKAYRFKKEHRIRLSLASSYWPIVWPSPSSLDLQITGGELRLPVFDGLPAGLTSDFPPALDLPRQKLHHMVVSPSLHRQASTERNGTLVTGWHQPYTEVLHVETDSSYGFETRATHRMTAKDPLSAASTVEHRVVYRRPDGTAELRSLVSVHGDGCFFYLEGQLVADWEGERIAERNWNSVVPRRYS
ncbi:MAG: CocE/NonD family hydrolase [Geminicoccaceae bacterium]